MSKPTDPMADMLQTAGIRPAPSAATTQRVRLAVAREFEAQAAQRRRHRRRLWGIAAVLGLLTVGIFLSERLRSQGQVIAQVSRVTGHPQTIAAGTAMRTGQTLRVPGGAGVLIAHGSGLQLRIDENSTLVFVDPESVRLERGAVYVATRAEARAGRSKALTVVTAWGTVAHLGTRFEVRLMADNLRLRVRDGAARFTPSTGPIATVNAGEQLDYRAGRIQISRGPSSVADDWQWVDRTGPAFSIEARNLLQALQWYSHEGGYQLEFVTDAARARAELVILHGDVSTLTPREALEVVLKGSPLRYEIDGDRLRVALP